MVNHVNDEDDAILELEQEISKIKAESQERRKALRLMVDEQLASMNRDTWKPWQVIAVGCAVPALIYLIGFVALGVW